VRGGGSTYHNKDFGFLGNCTAISQPVPIAVEDKLWKWVEKKVVSESVPLEEFYAANNLYHPRMQDTTDQVYVTSHHLDLNSA
jgi:hypothetical protein